MAICPHCNEVPDPDDIVAVDGDEVFDLIAEAALTSPPAARAYKLLRDANPAILPLEARQRVIKARHHGLLS
ncbi:hypothetical protein SAMN04488498_110192 [Mesorhizobium albiziae]|uniref:Uncharacterized protein n=1 Tax=Neomesorhizobium albiziae TaxID=335020 RepID=A0A1I4BLP1_9HYPH|nr:hypothetical protein [Mesorhizobium albiziae]GLS29924.1 hypothetical protein GCM10007937_16320 [Mesorhizobium albiziae]SFK68909.1 hypothetical protein SAMN04488498_110192 [Mesorhizobium albiziae]